MVEELSFYFSQIVQAMTLSAREIDHCFLKPSSPQRSYQGDAAIRRRSGRAALSARDLGSWVWSHLISAVLRLSSRVLLLGSWVWSHLISAVLCPSSRVLGSWVWSHLISAVLCLLVFYYGGIKNGHIRYPSHGGTQNRKEKRSHCISAVLHLSSRVLGSWVGSHLISAVLCLLVF